MIVIQSIGQIHQSIWRIHWVISKKENTRSIEKLIPPIKNKIRNLKLKGNQSSASNRVEDVTKGRPNPYAVDKMKNKKRNTELCKGNKNSKTCFNKLLESAEKHANLLGKPKEKMEIPEPCSPNSSSEAIKGYDKVTKANNRHVMLLSGDVKHEVNSYVNSTFSIPDEGRDDHTDPLEDNDKNKVSYEIQRDAYISRINKLIEEIRFEIRAQTSTSATIKSHENVTEPDHGQVMLLSDEVKNEPAPFATLNFSTPAKNVDGHPSPWEDNCKQKALYNKHGYVYLKKISDLTAENKGWCSLFLIQQEEISQLKQRLEDPNKNRGCLKAG